VASLQGGWVGVATALSPATVGHFKFLLHHFFVGLGLILADLKRQLLRNVADAGIQDAAKNDARSIAL